MNNDLVSRLAYSFALVRHIGGRIEWTKVLGDLFVQLVVGWEALVSMSGASDSGFRRSGTFRFWRCCSIVRYVALSNRQLVKQREKAESASPSPLRAPCSFSAQFVKCLRGRILRDAEDLSDCSKTCLRRRDQIDLIAQIAQIAFTGVAESSRTLF